MENKILLAIFIISYCSVISASRWPNSLFESLIGNNTRESYLHNEIIGRYNASDFINIPGRLGREKVDKTINELKIKQGKKFNATLIKYKSDSKTDSKSDSKTETNKSYEENFRMRAAFPGFPPVPKRDNSRIMEMERQHIIETEEKDQDKKESLWRKFLQLFKRFG